MAKRPPPATPLRTGTEHFVRVECERIKRLQVDPWALFHSGKPLEVENFWGQRIHYEGVKFEGTPRRVFWTGYIEPFLEDIVVRTLESVGKRLQEAREPEAVAAYAEAAQILKAETYKVYSRMVAIDRRLAGTPDRASVDVHPRSAPLHRFIERAVAEQVFTRRPDRKHEPLLQRDDAVGKRIQAVLEDAAFFRQREPDASIAAIAHKLAEQGTRQKCHGYGYVTVRKILSGTYRAAQRRRLPDLAGSMK